MNLKLRRIEAIPTTSSGGGKESGIDSSRLELLIESLKSEFIKQDDFQKIVKRVEALESLSQILKETDEKIQESVKNLDQKTESNTEEINKLKELIKGLQDKLSSKVECEDFDKIVALINNIKIG